MRIGIDARFYGPTGKGLGRYTQEIVDNIIKIVNADKFSQDEKNTSVSFGDDKIEFVIFLGRDNFDDFICSHSNVRKVFLRARWYSWQEQLLMPFVIWRERLDLIHYPHFNVPILTPCKFVVTIHDLILTNFPTLRATTLSPLVYYFKNFAYRLVIISAIKRARKVITVSQFTKDDLTQKFKIKADKIAVTYEGVFNLARGNGVLETAELNSVEVLKKYNIFNNNFLLYVGNAYPHKNLELLIRVFQRLLLQKQDLKLVLVGKEDYFYKKIHNYANTLGLWKENGAESSVVFTGYVPDNQLAILYQQAKAYVFPSLYEGFGLPPLEAMAMSCPVASSNRASLPEILGEAALYFNPENENDVIEKILDILNNEVLRDHLIARGINQVKKYDWQKCAQETLIIYQQAAND